MAIRKVTRAEPHHLRLGADHQGHEEFRVYRAERRKLLQNLQVVFEREKLQNYEE